MKRKRLEDTCVGLQDIEKTIKELKEQYKDQDTQIELYEFASLKGCYEIIIWAL